MSVNEPSEMVTAPNENLDSSKDNALKIGPLLVAIILNWWLLGVLFMQYLLYLSNGTRNDRKITRAIVHLIFLLNMVQSILIVEDTFNYFVFNFGNYEPSGRSGLSGFDGPVLDCIIAMIVQFVYAWRVWVLSRRKIFPIIVALLTCLSNAGGFAAGIYDAKGSFTYSDKIVQWYIPAMLWLWASAATDIVIAATMTYLLGFKSRGCSQGIKTALKRLLLLILETNALTAFAAIVTASLTLFPTLGPPFTSLHRLGGYNFGKLYSNCFMVLLNQRIYYKEFSQEERTTTELGTLEFAPMSGLRSGITHTNVTGEVSIIHFSEAATETNSKLGHSDNDVELGQSIQGTRILLNSAGATGEK